VAAAAGNQWADADERRHDGADQEEWTFAFWTPDGRLGGWVLLRLLPSARRCWYWTALARAGERLVHVTDWTAPLPRAGLTVRSEALSADHVCEAPFEQWTVANETYAVAVDDPDDVLGRAYGASVAVAFDLEWYGAGAPQPLADGYRQAGEVHGVIELAHGRVDLVAAPAERTHRWGAVLAPPPVEPGFAHVGLRAPARLPDGALVDLVLTADGWRARVPRSAP
jgi:hypothetical protein